MKPTRVHVAAARVQMALSRRRGEKAPDWIRQLAETPMSEAGAPMTDADAAIDYAARLRTMEHEVADWRRRHAEHAGHAPLSELDHILRGEHDGTE